MALPRAKPLSQEEQEKERRKYANRLANVQVPENRELLATTFQTHNMAAIRKGGTVYSILCDCTTSARELTTEQGLLLVAQVVNENGKVQKANTLTNTVSTWRTWLRRIGNPILDGVCYTEMIPYLAFEPNSDQQLKQPKQKKKVLPMISKVESSRVQSRSDAKLVLAITGRKYDTNSELDREAKEALLSLYKLV